MRITKTHYDEAKQSLVIQLGRRQLDLPVARLPLAPTPDNPLIGVVVDAECGNEAITYQLADGREGTVPYDAFLDYHSDPDYLHKIFLHRVAVQIRKNLGETPDNLHSTAGGLLARLKGSGVLNLDLGKFDLQGQNIKVSLKVKRVPKPRTKTGKLVSRA